MASNRSSSGGIAVGGNRCTAAGPIQELIRRAALERLRELQTPAVEALSQAIEAEEQQLARSGEVIALGPDHAVRLRAATSVLDRTGMGPTSSTDVNVQASVHLMELIAQLDDDQP